MALTAIVYSGSLSATSALPLLSAGLLGNEDFWRVVNLLVFLAILFYLLVYKVKIGNMLDQRGANVAKELEEARQEKLEAEHRLLEVEQRLRKLDSEVVELRVQSEAEAKREVERIREAAKADAEKIRQMARREIEGAMLAARAELRAFVADHSVSMAEGIIRKEIRPEDETRIIGEYVGELGEARR